MHIKNVPIGSIKAGPEDGLKEGEFIVYPSTFTRTPDAYGDVVVPGAFLDDIQARKEAGTVLPGLYGHRMDDPDYSVAYAIEEGEDETGWWVKGAFDLESPKAQQVYRLAKGKRLNQLSFAYDVLDDGKATNDDGETVNELRRLKVYEFSFVPVGANQDTSIVAIKALSDGIKAGRVLSAKNQSALQEARDSIDSVLASLSDDEDGKAAPAASQEKASGHTEAKPDASDEEPSEAKSSVSGEEPRVNPSARALAAKYQTALYDIEHAPKETGQ